jgi:hypothetical protein
MGHSFARETIQVSGNVRNRLSSRKIKFSPVVARPAMEAKGFPRQGGPTGGML